MSGGLDLLRNYKIFLRLHLVRFKFLNPKVNLLILSSRKSPRPGDRKLRLGRHSTSALQTRNHNRTDYKSVLASVLQTDNSNRTVLARYKRETITALIANRSEREDK